MTSCSQCPGLTHVYARSAHALIVVLIQFEMQCTAPPAGPVRYQPSLLPQVQTSPQVWMIEEE